MSEAVVCESPFVRSVALMGTVVTIQVVRSGPTAAHGANDAAALAASVDRAFAWFERIEEVCTRFDPASEVMQLAARPGEAIPVSAILFEAVRFSLAVAAESDGAFDPTVGHAMELRGFNEEYRTRQPVHTALAPDQSPSVQNRPVSYRDVQLDAERRTITLLRPLILDLGAVAKGLAIDMAAKELAPFENFCVDAGGDLYLAGRNPSGEPWSVGIRHPRRANELIDSLRVSNAAVCTSGDYERTAPAKHTAAAAVPDAAHDALHHILDPRKGASAGELASVTVVAPTAILADAVATAAFVLGPSAGLRLCEKLGLDALLLTPALERHTTRGMRTAHAS